MIGEIGGNMNNKGQALIEFVLILPVFIFILFAVIDFGIIFSSKNNIESDSTDIINLFKNGVSVSEIEEMYDDHTIDVSNDGEYYKFTIFSCFCRVLCDLKLCFIKRFSIIYNILIVKYTIFFFVGLFSFVGWIFVDL